MEKLRHRESDGFLPDRISMQKQKTALIESCFLFLSRPSFAAMVGRVGRLFARTEFASGAGSLADLAVGAQVEPQACELVVRLSSFCLRFLHHLLKLECFESWGDKRPKQS